MLQDITGVRVQCIYMSIINREMTTRNMVAMHQGEDSKGKRLEVSNIANDVVIWQTTVVIQK
jgi:hypothetical protein